MTWNLATSPQRIACLVGLLATVSCAAGINPRNSSDIAARTEIQYDPHDAVTRARAPTVDSINDRTYYFLRSASVDGQLSTQLYVRMIFSNWAFLDSAYSEGRRLDVTKIGSDVSCSRYGCAHYEHIGINFDIDTLRKLALKEIVSIKVAGRHGSRVVDIPGQYFVGFLSAIDAASFAQG